MKKISGVVSITEYKPQTIFADDTEFNGELNFKNPVEIKGKFKGKIYTESVVIISEDGMVEADIKANIVIIAGTVKGNVEAKKKVEILSTGKLYGDIKTAKLKIADGVIFEGSCHMIKDEN